MRRALIALTTSVVLLAVTASSAFAQASGEGIFESDDRTVTTFAFIVIGFFPLFILLASLLQWQLEKRKDRRKKAKRSAPKTDPQVWSGGW